MSFKGFPSFLMCVLISFKPPACADAHHAANLPSCKPGNTSYSGFDYVLVDPRHRCGETAGNCLDRVSGPNALHGYQFLNPLNFPCQPGRAFTF